MGTEKNEPHIPYLDGVRGIAVLLVWISHFFPEFYPFRFGWIGVNLFFILSGYFITGRLFHHEKEGTRKYFLNFYGRRILRIFPLYYGCLIVFFLLLPHLYGNYDRYFSGLYHSQAWYWLYMENWWMVLNGLPGNVILITLWSLAVEEQFYLFWPLLFLFAKMLNRKAIIGILWLTSILVRVLTSDPLHIYFSTLTACEPLLMGALICILEREGRLEKLRRLSLAGIFISITIIFILYIRDGRLTAESPLLMRYGYSAIDWVLGAFLTLTLLAGRFSIQLRTILQARWLVWCGKYSYGIYIFHWFILQIFVFKWESILSHHLKSMPIVYFLPRFAGIVAILFCSYISYRFYESRFLRLKHIFQ